MKTETIILISKIKSEIYAILAIAIAFLTPIIPLILIVGLAIFLDTFIAIYKAYKLNEKITSKKLSAVVSKMVLYQSAIIGFFCIEKYILGDLTIMLTSIPLVLTKLVAVTLLFIEGQSIIENYSAVSGINIFNKFKELLSRTKYVKNIIEITFEDITKVKKKKTKK